jgi:hypothetical protein
MSPTHQILGVPPVALSATATSGQPVAFASNTPIVCRVQGASAILTSGGTCSITASQTGNAAHAAAPPVTHTFTVVGCPALLGLVCVGVR